MALLNPSKDFVMMNALPAWLLPFWIIGIPLLLAMVDLARTSKANPRNSESWQRAVPLAVVPA